MLAQTYRPLELIVVDIGGLGFVRKHFDRGLDASNTREATARVMAVARTFDWSEQMSRMSELIETALAAKRTS